MNACQLLLLKSVDNLLIAIDGLYYCLTLILLLQFFTLQLSLNLSYSSHQHPALPLQLLTSNTPILLSPLPLIIRIKIIHLLNISLNPPTPLRTRDRIEIFKIMFSDVLLYVFLVKGGWTIDDVVEILELGLLFNLYLFLHLYIYLLCHVWGDEGGVI